MEIILKTRSLAAIALLLSLALAIALGLTHSPRVRGRPILLTRENRAIMLYLDQAEAWERTLQNELERLSALTPQNTPVPQETPGTLPRLPTASGPGDLYARSRLAREATDNLEKIRREMDTANVPLPLISLHALAIDAAQDALNLAGEIAAYIGAPSEERRQTIAKGETKARGSLEKLRQAIRNKRRESGE